MTQFQLNLATNDDRLVTILFIEFLLLKYRFSQLIYLDSGRYIPYELLVSSDDRWYYNLRLEHDINLPVCIPSGPTLGCPLASHKLRYIIYTRAHTAAIINWR